MIDWMIIWNIVLLALGFVLLVKGADWFVEGSAGIAAKFKIPQLVIGLTIVAMGTSAPEAAVSIDAALKDTADIAVGNIVGSNILNILIILGLTGLITKVAVQKSTLFIEIPFMIVITIVMIVLGVLGNSLSFWDGIIMWGLFLVYLGYLFVQARKNSVEEQPEERSIWKLLLLGVGGLGLVILGAKLSVDSATYVATAVGIDTRFIGLTVMALGTSLPELVTSVVAAKKGNADIAIGNIVGSNIFNILFVLGTSALITPVLYENAFIIDSVIAIAAGVILWLTTIRRHELRRWGGILMLLCYAAYFVYLLMFAPAA